jgi:selenocysteine lyase/cysteine desulfurase
MTGHKVGGPYGVGVLLLARDVPVLLNRLILEYDHLVICGPVFRPNSAV